MSLPSLTPPAGPRRALAVTTVGLALVAVTLFLYWPLGVLIGLALGILVVLGLGRQQDRAARAVPVDDDLLALLPAAHRPEVPARPVAEADLAPARAQVAAVRPARVAAREAVPVPAVSVPAVPAPAVITPAVPVTALSARAIPTNAVTEPDAQGVRADLDRLKAALGDDYPDFARAARLVVSTQYASAARLQRDLQLPYSRARRLLADLETEHFVGPATGTLPRQVLLPKERLPEVERLFAGV